MHERSRSIDELVSIRAALATYRDVVDELERENWSGDVIDSVRRLRALHRISVGRTTHQLEQLAGLQERP